MEQVDPFSALTQGSISLHEWFVSLLEADFTEPQALTLISLVIANQAKDQQ